MFMEIRGTEKMKNITKEEINIKEFFDDIMDVVTMLGGELNDAF